MPDLRGRSGQERLRPGGERARAGLPAAAAAILAALTVLLGACALNPFGEAEPEVLAASAAEASMQTYAKILGVQRPGAATAAAGEAALSAAPAERAAADDRPEERGADLNQPERPGLGNARQVAALPRADEPQIAVRVLFSPVKAELSPEEEDDLSAMVAQLLREENPPVEILAYWSGDEDSAPLAKIQAVKRAMKVRSFLKMQGLDRAPIVITRVQDPQSGPKVIDVVLAGR